MCVSQPHQSVNPQPSDRSIRDRIAQVIYGDGDELSWARSVELADLIMWEIRR